MHFTCKAVSCSGMIFVKPNLTSMEKKLKTHLVHRRNEAEIDELRGDPVSPVAHHRCSVVGSELVLDLQNTNEDIPALKNDSKTIAPSTAVT